MNGDKFFTEIAWQLDTCDVGFTWDPAQDPEKRCVLSSCPGRADLTPEAVSNRRGKLSEDKPGFTWGAEIDLNYTCSNRGCLDIEVPGNFAKRLLLFGSETNEVRYTINTTCPSTYFSSIQIYYYSLGVAVGFGDTQEEADAAAVANLP